MYFKKSRKDKTSCISWTDPVVVCWFCKVSDTELCWIILYFALKSDIWTTVGVSFIKHFGKFIRILSSLISMSRIWLYNCRDYNDQRVALCHPRSRKIFNIGSTPIRVKGGNCDSFRPRHILIFGHLFYKVC